MPTPSRTFRIPDALFVEAKRVTKANGTSVNAVVVRGLEDYIADVEWRDRALAAEARLRELGEVSSSAPPQSR